MRLCATARSRNNCRMRILHLVVSLYPVWTDVDAIYQVLKQAGEIRGNSTNSPPTPPTAELTPAGTAPSSARASSHPCSSSTSGKAHHQIPIFSTWNRCTLNILSFFFYFFFFYRESRETTTVFAERTYLKTERKIPTFSQAFERYREIPITFKDFKFY